MIAVFIVRSLWPSPISICHMRYRYVDKSVSHCCHVDQHKFWNVIQTMIAPELFGRAVWDIFCPNICFKEYYKNKIWRLWICKSPIYLVTFRCNFDLCCLHWLFVIICLLTILDILLKAYREILTIVKKSNFSFLWKCLF